MDEAGLRRSASTHALGAADNLVQVPDHPGGQAPDGERARRGRRCASDREARRYARQPSDAARLCGYFRGSMVGLGGGSELLPPYRRACDRRVPCTGVVPELLADSRRWILVAVSFGPAWSWTSSSRLGFLVGGLALLVGWCISASAVREPLVDLGVLKERGRYLTTLGAGLAYGTTGLFTILLPKLVMTPAVLGLGYGFGVSPEGFAMFQAPLSAMIVHSRCLAASSRWKFRRRLSRGSTTLSTRKADPRYVGRHAEGPPLGISDGAAWHPVEECRRVCGADSHCPGTTSPDRGDHTDVRRTPQVHGREAVGRCIRDRGGLPDERKPQTNGTANRIGFKDNLTRAISNVLGGRWLISYRKLTRPREVKAPSFYDFRQPLRTRCSRIGTLSGRVMQSWFCETQKCSLPEFFKLVRESWALGTLAPRACGVARNR